MIPRFEEIRIQALKELSAGVTMRAKDLRIPLARHFGLTDEEMNAWYPSGNGEIKNSGTVTKLSNDGGIDGTIKEDVLGFNHISIHLMANRISCHLVTEFSIAKNSTAKS